VDLFLAMMHGAINAKIGFLSKIYFDFVIPENKFVFGGGF